MKCTLLRILPLATLAALTTLAAAPATAEAQSLNVRRSEHAPAARTDAQVAAFEEVKAAMHALFDAQRAHHAAHGRFAKPQELEDLELALRSIGGLTVEDGWYAATGGDAAVGLLQHVVTFDRRDEQAAGAAAEAQRAAVKGG